MKLLISVYACRPNAGSELEVGWSWVKELCKQHELWVLTNYTNEPFIREYLDGDLNKIKNVHWVFVRPNKKLTFWYKEYERMERIFYVLWQRKAAKVAKSLNKEIHFDFAQHITYVTCVLPSYMNQSGIPFIYGPVSGGENIPEIIQYPMSPRDRVIELVRSATQLIPKFYWATHRAFKDAKKIIPVTEETLELIPEKYREKTIVMQAIGLNEDYFEPAPLIQKKTEKTMKILMAGRMLSWKGFELGILAVRTAIKKGADIELTVLGNGNQSYMEKLYKLAGKEYGKKIQFVRYVEHDRMREFYETFDVLLNCSMRDSGCMIVMEAMGRGIPVICLNVGGPKINTTDLCAVKIEPAPFRELVQTFSDAICEMANNPEKRLSMAQCAYEHAKTHFKMSDRVKKMSELYQQIRE